MEYYTNGRVLRGVGGLYAIRLDGDVASADETGPLAGRDIVCRAKGAFRHEGISPLAGDRVRVRYTDASFSPVTGDPSPDGTDVRIEDILPRKNALIRPAMANLDYLFITMASACPAPLTDVVDKLISIAEFNRIEPVIVIGKAELDRACTDRLTDIYRRAGYPVFPLSGLSGEGTDPLRAYISEHLPGATAAFCGASGVGKSTLLNVLFPGLGLETGAVSRKVARGRHTTRRVELYAVIGEDAGSPAGYLADTPGFSMLDFVRFDFFDKDDLPMTMREFRPYLGTCRWTTCTHTKEEDCPIVRAVRGGIIPASRHESYLRMYNDLKDKHDWDRPRDKK